MLVVIMGVACVRGVEISKRSEVRGKNTRVLRAQMDRLSRPQEYEGSTESMQKTVNSLCAWLNDQYSLRSQRKGFSMPPIREGWKFAGYTNCASRACSLSGAGIFSLELYLF